MQVKELISAYGKHLQQARGVTESTRRQYIYYVQRFLGETFADVFPDKLRHLQPSELIQYYAIALCLARLGLRRKEVAHLNLDDFNWRSGVVHITTSKSRRFSTMPLPEDVGKAIVDYLRNGRPPTEERRVFVCHRHRIGAPLQSVAIGTLIRRRFKRTRIKVSGGTHILRHTVPTQMVQQGVSIKEIADFLRHRSLDTTVIYAKVNLPMLLEVASPWPKVGETT